MSGWKPLAKDILMNERLRALAAQAKLNGVKFDDLSFYVGTEETFSEFTKLVVQDVLNLFGDERISLHYLEQPCCEDSVYLLQSKIKEHFGIE